MSFGMMNSFINIISTEPIKDAEGFVTTGDRIIASVKAYKEIRNTSTKWERIIGNAAFSTVTALFRFRKIPGLTVDTTLFISDMDGRYNIISVEDVRGRGMYVEVLAEKSEGSIK
ncbi:MAG: head-tail adaptor protein [Eubacteriales bacterium]|nr:head-tail adaptor protein [Eubacteriales bacterium]MDD4475537.1 head-tail adaptor protein [Eubacteriales bacterium]